MMGRIPGKGRVAVRPLQYGNVLRFYENAERSASQLAAVFRNCLVGFEECTADDIKQMPPGTPAMLEIAILSASELLDAPPENQQERGKPHPDQIDPPENSIWADHNKSKRQKATENAKMSDADTQYILHDNNETFESIYRMLMPEIRLLIEGAKRQAERREEQTSGNSGSSGNIGSGNKSDRAAAMGWR